MTDEEIIQAARSAKRSHVIGGMTVNERLFVAGLFDEFYEAKDRDREKAYKILELLDVDVPSINIVLKDSPPN